MSGAAAFLSSLIFATALAAPAPVHPAVSSQAPAGEEVQGATPPAAISIAAIAPKQPVSDEFMVKTLVDHYAADLTAKDRTRLYGFTKCESDYTQFNTDGSPYMSGYGTPDCGAFQLNKVHWDGPTATSSIVCISLEANVKTAVDLYRKYGGQPWDNSKSCWNKPVPGW